MIRKDREFRIKIAKDYYIQGLSQKEISKKFNISRPSVSSILKCCREEKVVEIRIHQTESSRLEDSAERLKEKFALNSAIVVSSSDDNTSTLSKAGTAAAILLKSKLKDDLEIGLSWGSTLFHVVEAVDFNHFNKLKIVQLTGSLGMKELEYDGFELARKMARKLKANNYFIQSPAIVKSIELRQMLIKEHSIDQTMKYMKSLDIALVGLSSDNPTHSSMVKEGFLEIAEAEHIQSLGGTGHVCALHYDKEGNFLDIEQNDRVVGVDAKTFVKIPEVVGVACGVEKTHAILGALRGRLVNSLVTDEHAVVNLLNNI